MTADAGAGGYTGDVRPGGPPAVRVLDEVVLRKLSVGPLDNEAYTLVCRRTGAQLLVDAAAEPDRLLTLVRDGSPRLDLVVTTHRHADHLGALAAVLDATGAAHAAGDEDAAAVAAGADTFDCVSPSRVARRAGTSSSLASAAAAVSPSRVRTPSKV